jgi:hypothetical protein
MYPGISHRGFAARYKALKPLPVRSGKPCNGAGVLAADFKSFHLR